MMKRSLLIFAAIMTLAGTALAQQAAPPPQPNDVPLHRYADADKTCLEWSDSCRTCKRVGNTSACSNIGIACQPQPITCVRREEPAK
jgi:hypothetical protein